MILYSNLTNTTIIHPEYQILIYVYSCTLYITIAYYRTTTSRFPKSPGDQPNRLLVGARSSSSCGTNDSWQVQISTWCFPFSQFMKHLFTCEFTCELLYTLWIPKKKGTPHKFQGTWHPVVQYLLAGPNFLWISGWILFLTPASFSSWPFTQPSNFPPAPRNVAPPAMSTVFAPIHQICKLPMPPFLA